MRFRLAILAAAALVATTSPAHASFHFMQIEQVIGAVNGDVTAQAVQLRMRAGGQNNLQFGKLVVRDAAGLNPVLLVDCGNPVPVFAPGSHVLIATAAWGTNCGITPDFTMVPIPASYLPAGSLTFEADAGTIYWRLSWGGAAYTGPGTGSPTNDTDANFNPPYPLPLASAGDTTIRFKFGSGALSTNNANDYAAVLGPVTFTTNQGATCTIAPVGVEELPLDRVMLGRPSPNPVTGTLGYGLSLPRAGVVRVRVFDVRGRLVKGLLDQVLPAGAHHFMWNAAADGARLGSGTYYLRLEALGVTQSRKFSFIR